MGLRPYQTKAIQAVRDNYKNGINRQLLCMSTGCGKTLVAAYLIPQTEDILPGQAMFLVHRDELAKQALDTISKTNPSLNVNQEAGSNKCDPSITDVIIASVQTLGRKNTERVKKFNWENISRIITDEAHRSTADSYLNVYNAGSYLSESSKRLMLGITATPVRGDGQGLGNVYKKIVFNYDIRQGIEEGYLVEIKGIRVNTQTSLDGVGTKGGDYDQEELADTVNNPYRNRLVAKAYIEHCNPRQAIGFAVNIKHAHDLALEFQKHGINAEAVWGIDPDRDYKIKAFRNGEIQVLFNAQLLTEGFDVPSIECVILAAPTKSPVVFSQRVGRGTRLFEGKNDCIILDVCDSTSRHSLITLPTLLGMPSGLDLHGHGLIESIKLIEDKLKEYPHLDFSTLKDIDKIEAFVEEVNLFEVKFPPEVEVNSQFTWHHNYLGGYILMLPDKESVTIDKNILDKFVLSGIIRGKKYKGERDTIEDAFFAADTLIAKEIPEVLKIVKREAEWHKLEPTEGQLKLINKIYKGKQIPELTRGSASKLIGSYFASKGSK